MSQWSTLSSGPLARRGDLKKGANRVKSQEPGKRLKLAQRQALEKGSGRVESPQPKKKTHKKSEAELGWLAFTLAIERLFSFCV